MATTTITEFRRSARDADGRIMDMGEDSLPTRPALRLVLRPRSAPAARLCASRPTPRTPAISTAPAHRFCTRPARSSFFPAEAGQIITLAAVA